ncbi:MAG: proprotein convertase P-domain-containing protein [Chloroflexi bacterium]|nr:proprotein convertase P-domain-containing protein [Chloroflexota bacterium]
MDSSENLEVDVGCSPGTPTLSGRFRPNEGFFRLDGESIAGTWTLRVFDDAAGHQGTLNDWSITASLDGPPAVCPPATISGDAFSDALPAPLAIPDGFIDGRLGMVEDCITIDADTNIEALVVTLDIEHTAVGDVIVTLTHEDTGSSVDLLFGLDCDGDDIVVTLDDAADSPVDDQCGAGSPSITGTFRPSQRLSEFDDESIAGTWVLEVDDGQPTETGALNGWSLSPGQPVPCSPASGSGHVFAAQLNAPLPIPDDDPDGATNCITISDARPINSVSVAIDISHPSVADLGVTLTHVETDSVMLLILFPTTESGEPCPGADIDVILVRSGAPDVDAACSPGTPTLSGTFKRTVSNPAFSGESMAGTWTLKVQDVNEGQLGTLNDWSIIAGLEGPPAVCPTAVGSGDSFSDSLPAPLAIPGDDPVGVMDCITIQDERPILDLDVALDIDANVGDLVIRLTHDDTGTTIVLMDRPGVPCAFCICGYDGIDVVLNDEATSLVQDECTDASPTKVGEFRRNEPLSAFDGESLAGNWTLHIVDDIEGSQGDLIGWTLIVGPEDEATVTPTVTPQATGTPLPPPPGGPVGDASCDDTVNAIDAAFILQFGAGLIGGLPCAGLADANQDGDVTSIDAALVLQFTAGLLGMLPP